MTPERMRAPLPRPSGSPLVGRERELQTVLSLLERDTPVVTLTGPSGVGKTRLALSVLEKQPRDVVVVPLSAVTEQALVSDAIVACVAPDQAPVLAAAGALWHCYAGEPVLLLLDNLEQIEGVGEVVGSLLEEYPAVQVLSTSIRPLGLAEERVVRLRPLGVGDGGPDKQSPALELFLERAAAADAAFVADDVAVAGALAVCREVAGLPLAIELAAARVASVPPAVMARELARTGGLTLLAGGAGTVPDRHRSLEAALRWTYALLAPAAADLFARLSVFEGPATLEAVAMVAAPANDVLERLSALVDVQLVDLDVADPQEPLFSLGRPIRAFAADQLQRVGGTHDAQRQHDDYFRLRARAGGPLPAREVPDLVATLDRVVLAGHVDTALEAALRASQQVASPGAGAALEARIAQMLEHPGTDPALEARALAWTTVHGGSGATDHQVYAQWTSDRVRQALRTARESGDTPALLTALELTIRSVPTTLDRDLAVASLQEGLALAERSGDERMLAHFRLWAGMLAHANGQAPMAIGLLGAALDVGTALHDSLVTEYAGMFLLGVEADGTATGRELPDPRDLLQAAGQRGDAWAAAWLCTLLASLSLAEGALEPAAEYTGQLLSLGVQRQAVEPIFGPIGITVAVRLLVAAGDLEQAACLAAAITPLAKMLPRSMPVRYWSAYTDSVAALLALPAEQRMAAEGRGRALSIGEALPAAQQWVWAIVARRRPPAVQPAGRPGPESLTQREREVLALLAEGAGNREIAARLTIADKTVMHHTMSIYRKLGVRGRSEAAAWAVRSGMASSA